MPITNQLHVVVCTPQQNQNTVTKWINCQLVAWTHAHVGGTGTSPSIVFHYQEN